MFLAKVLLVMLDVVELWVESLINISYVALE